MEDFLSQKARGRDEGDLRWISQDRDQVDGNGFAVCGIKPCLRSPDVSLSF